MSAPQERINLEPVGRNSASHWLPELKGIVPLIWPHHSESLLPWVAVKEYVEEVGSGEVYAISDARGRLIGMTGWYWREANPTNAGLRWTGILPEFRKQGYFATTVNRIEMCVLRIKPAVHTLSEILPRGRVAELLPIFSRLGFHEVADFLHERSEEVQGTNYLADGMLIEKQIR